MLISRSERGLMETCCDVTGLWLRTRVRMPEDGRKARERQEAISKTQPKDVSDANAGIGDVFDLHPVDIQDPAALEAPAGRKRQVPVANGCPSLFRE